MPLPLTLSLYIGRQYLMGILAALGAILAVVTVADLVELIRRTSNKEGVDLALILEMAILKIPDMANLVLPFAVLAGSMLTLHRLTRSHELVVTRAAGISVWQFLTPALAMVLLIAVFNISIFNPISSAMLLRFEMIEARYISGQPSLLSVSNSGLWLRQIEEGDGPVREHVFHAMRVMQENMQLREVIVFSFDASSRFVQRIDAASALLKPDYWELREVIISEPGKPPETMPLLSLPTDLTMSQIQESFASPKTISFWELPSFINTLEAAGFSALRHKLHWHAMLASTVLLAGMILVAAVFSLRLPRRGGALWLVIGGVTTSVVLYFLTDVVHALGSSGSLPVLLAAWAPAAIVVMVGVTFLLHHEDG